MLAEFVEELKRLAVNAAEPKIIEAVDGQDPSKRHIFNPATKELTEVTVLPPRRSHSVLTLLSLANAVDNYANRESLSLWATLGQVVAVLDDSEESFRRDQIKLTLLPSPLFDELAKCGTRGMGQKEFYWLLKHTFAKADFVPAGLIDVISTMKFESGQTIEGQVSAVGKNTMGRSVMAEATGAGALPEELDIGFEPWPSARLFEQTFKVAVRCSLKTDALEGKFYLTPQPGELDAAKAKSLDALCQRVAEICGVESDIVFAGTP